MIPLLKECPVAPIVGAVWRRTEERELVSALTSYSVHEVDVQKRLFAAEHRMVLTLGTLPPLVPELQAKYDLARMTYEDATHAQALRTRTAQMRGGTRPEPLNDTVARLFDRALSGPSTSAILLAVFGVLKDDLVRAYRAYMEGTHPVGDQPTIVVLESALEQEIAQVETGLAMAESLNPSVEDRAWAEDLRLRLRAAGGIDARAEEGRAAQPPDDSRLQAFHLPARPNWGDHPVCYILGSDDPDRDIIPRCFDPAADARLTRVGMYSWLFHEADVLDYLPRVFLETPGMPFEFHYDLARHLWDESRHSNGGYLGLKRLGFDPRCSEHSLVISLATASMSALELYAAMTQVFEAGSFKPKAEIIRKLDTLDDADLSAFLRYDRADETTHVAFGTKWIPELARYCGVELTFSEIVDVARQKFWAEYAAGEARYQFPCQVDPEDRISYNAVARRYGLPTVSPRGTTD